MQIVGISIEVYLGHRLCMTSHKIIADTHVNMQANNLIANHNMLSLTSGFLNDYSNYISKLLYFQESTFPNDEEIHDNSSEIEVVRSEETPYIVQEKDVFH